MHRLGLARIALATLLLAACGEAGTAQAEFVPVRPASLAELMGPWRPTPLVLDPAMRARVAQECRREMERQPGSVAAVMDGRGEGVVTVRMTGQSAGTCDALQITPGGQVVGAGGGMTMEGIEKLPVIGESELGAVEKMTVTGGELTVEGWSLFGRAGPAIASVVIEPLDHAVVVATLENGWFGAWWPGRLPQQEDAIQIWPKFAVRGYDAGGTLVAEIAPDP